LGDPRTPAAKKGTHRSEAQTDLAGHVWAFLFLKHFPDPSGLDFLARTLKVRWSALEQLVEIFSANRRHFFR
jgi:hypothetical protein